LKTPKRALVEERCRRSQVRAMPRAKCFYHQKQRKIGIGNAARREKAEQKI